MICKHILEGCFPGYLIGLLSPARHARRHSCHDGRARTSAGALDAQSQLAVAAGRSKGIVGMREPHEV